MGEREEIVMLTMMMCRWTGMTEDGDVTEGSLLGGLIVGGGSDSPYICDCPCLGNCQRVLQMFLILHAENERMGGGTVAM